jgi:hypothetical protein
MVQAKGGVSIVYHSGLEFVNGGSEGLDITDLISEICTLECPQGKEKTEPVPEVEAPAETVDKEADTDKGFEFAM